MKLSRKQFDILTAMVEDKTAAKTQRELESITGFSLGTVNRVVNELVENGLIKDGKITGERKGSGCAPTPSETVSESELTEA